MKHLIAPLFLLIACTSSAQTNLAGTYRGTLFQASGGLEDQYDFQMDIRETGSGQYSGKSTILIYNASMFGVMDVRIWKTGDYLHFEETGIISSYIEGGTWCLKKGRLSISEANNTITLDGKWEGVNNCVSPGTLTLTKTASHGKPSADKGSVLLNGFVQDENDTREYVRATLTFISKQDILRQAQSAENGSYAVKLKPGTMYNVVVMADGYLVKKIDLYTNKQDQTKDILVEKDLLHATKKSVRLDKVYFNVKEPVLQPESFQALEKLSDLMLDNRNMMIRLEGHVDKLKDPESAVQLSTDRAEAVKQYLVSMGISGSRITCKGYGYSKPRFSPPNQENNRIEFVITKR